MITIDITLTLKKGVTVSTKWGIEQERVYPDFESTWALRWRNTGGLLPTYCQPATGLPHDYRVALLRNDQEVTDMSSRVNYAGYAPNHDDNPAPGTFSYRGQDLGEVTATSGHYYQWRVRGYGTPTASERELLDAQVLPALQAAITAHKDELRAECLAAIRQYVSEKLADTRARLDVLEREMTTALDAIEAAQ